MPGGPNLAAGRAWTPFAGESRLRAVFRVVRSSVGLMIIALGLGLALAAGMGALVWAIATALHHASSA